MRPGTGPAKMKPEGGLSRRDRPPFLLGFESDPNFILRRQTMVRTRIAWPPTLLFLSILMMAPALGAQDEVRLTDGGVLEGEIISVSESEVALRHKSFGVIKIPRYKIERMGAYGTLDQPDEEAAGEDEDSAVRRQNSAQGSSASRLDLDYEPERYQPVPIPGAENPAGPDELSAEMEARPDLARLYEILINRDVIDEDSALVLFSLNEKWAADPASLTVLEKRVMDTLMGEAPESATVRETEYRNPPPLSLAPIVDEIRGKLEGVGELSYRERYTVEDGDGRIVVEYDRQVSRPDLIAGTGKVIEHVKVAEVGKAVRYFGDGHMLWLLTRREGGAPEEGDRGPNPFGASADAASANTPQAARADFAAWAAAGFPIERMTRADLLLVPFNIVDLATLELVEETGEAWVLKARVDTPAFDPMTMAELRIAKPTGFLESMELTGETGSALLEILDARVDPGLPPTTFVVPEAPEGAGFDVVQAPGSPADALAMLGAL